MNKGLPESSVISDEKIKIWRYINFSKYVDMLLNKSLYFVRADEFDDLLDGAYSFYSEKEEISPVEKRFNSRIRMNSLINCWHASSYESEAMWRLYSNTGEGIVIQSTVEDLKSSFVGSKLMVGKVRYIDFNKESNYSAKGFEPIFTKRNSFDFEKEIRAVYNTHPESSAQRKDSIYSHGVKVEVDLNRLIKAVKVNPKAPSYILDLVKKITRKHLSDVKVTRSQISDLG